jgi:hypothetical protein
LIRNQLQSERALVYECTAYCGGTGDRLRGIITAFYLAILTRRALFLHVTIPQPLETFFDSHFINWQLPSNWPKPQVLLDHIDYSSTLLSSVLRHDMVRFR